MAKEEESTALARVNPQALIQSAIEHGAQIETLERLLAMAKDLREIQAKEAWFKAMAKFQETCPPILKSKKAQIPSKSGGSGYSYGYAPLNEILGKIQPVMGPLGLSVSFRFRYEADKERVVANCWISHEMGHHEESGDISMPIGTATDGSGATPAQKVGIASTYAKRYALLAIIGIAPEEDGDAKAEPSRPTVDMPRRASEVTNQAPPPAAKPVAQAAEPRPVQPGARLISEPRHKRLWAIAYAAGNNLDLHKDDVNDKVHAIIGKYGFDSTNDVTDGKYDQICREIEEWGAGG